MMKIEDISSVLEVCDKTFVSLVYLENARKEATSLDARLTAQIDFDTVANGLLGLLKTFTIDQCDPIALPPGTYIAYTEFNLAMGRFAVVKFTGSVKSFTFEYINYNFSIPFSSLRELVSCNFIRVK